MIDESARGGAARRSRRLPWLGCFVLAISTGCGAEAPERGVLEGHWVIGMNERPTVNGASYDIEQNGDTIAVKFVTVTEDQLSRGYEVGMVRVKGTFKAPRLTGTILQHFHLTSRDTCPKVWEQWVPIDLTLSADGARLDGTYENVDLNASTCELGAPYSSSWQLLREAALDAGSPK